MTNTIKNQNYYKTNESLWNKRTPVHVESDFYAMEDFLNGANSLKSIEMKSLGDVQGKSLLHLQCHFGQDTLSWARLGAKVTGMDFSEAAIVKARELNEKTRIGCALYPMQCL